MHDVAAAKATQKADDTKKAAKEGLSCYSGSIATFAILTVAHHLASDKALKEEKAAQAAKGITDIAEDEAGAKKRLSSDSGLMAMFRMLIRYNKRL